MFEKFSLEYQVNKRIKTYLLHMATMQNLEPTNARLVFKSAGGSASLHLYDLGRHIREIDLSSVAEFFGHEYKQDQAGNLNAFLQKTADEEVIALADLQLVICEVKAQLGAHLFDKGKYRRKMSILDLVTHFTQAPHE